MKPLKFWIKSKASYWQEAMVAANFDIFEMSYDKSVTYFKYLKNLEKIWHTSGMATLPSDNKKPVTTSVGESKKSSDQCCHYCDKSNHNKADC